MNQHCLYNMYKIDHRKIFAVVAKSVVGFRTSMRSLIEHDINFPRVSTVKQCDPFYPSHTKLNY